MISEKDLVKKLKLRQAKRRSTIFVYVILLFLIIPSLIWTGLQHQEGIRRIERSVDLISGSSGHERLGLIIFSITTTLRSLQTLKIGLLVLGFMAGSFFAFLYSTITGEDKTRILIKLWDKIETLENRN